MQHGAINICTSPLNRLHCYKWSQVDHWLRWIQVAKINFSQRRSTLITIASRVSLPLYEVYTLARASTCIIYKMCSCLHLLQSGKRRGSGYHVLIKMDKNLWNASVFLSSASFYIIIMWSRRAETSKTQHTGSRKLIDGKIYIYIGKNCQLYRVNFKEVNWQLTKTFASQSKS